MIPLNSLTCIGNDLHRPECVLCTKTGNVYVSDWRGGITVIHPNHSQETFLTKDASFLLQPNGFALMPDGSFLIAHLGENAGGVYQLLRDGTLIPYLTEIDGRPLPPSNFVHLDNEGRVWITVSTRIQPRADAYRSDIADGFIILKDNHDCKIIADEIGYTNECIVDPSGQWLYVNETMARRTSRYPILNKTKLGKKETVSEYGEGTFPDGLCFAEDGSIWITSIVSNRVIRVDEDGSQTIILEDSEQDHIEWVEQAFQSHTMGKPHLGCVKSSHLQNISSLAFGGVDLKTAYLGCLLGHQITKFQSPVAGIPPSHWEFDQ